LAECYDKALFAYRDAGRGNSQGVVDFFKSLNSLNFLAAGVGAQDAILSEKNATRDYRFFKGEKNISSGIKGGLKGLIGQGVGALGKLVAGAGLGGLLVAGLDGLIGRESFLSEAINECNQGVPDATDKVSPIFFQTIGRTSNVDAAQNYVDKYR
jgi:hypothetical protein